MATAGNPPPGGSSSGSPGAAIVKLETNPAFNKPDQPDNTIPCGKAAQPAPPTPKEAVKYLVWDGVYQIGGVCNQLWGQRDAAPGAASAGRLSVDVLSVSPYFAPIEEHAIIKIRIVDTEAAGGLLLQIRNAEGSVVYEEMLEQRQVWGLPESDAGLSSGGNLPYDPPRRGAITGCAAPVRSPYTVTVWVAPDRGALAYGADPATAAGEARPNRPAPDNPPPPLTPLPEGGTLEQRQRREAIAARRPNYVPRADRTSVHYHHADFQVIPWPELYREAADLPPAGEAGPPPGGPADLLWIKQRLNDIGIPAGPVTGDPGDPDFQKALRRYRLLRGLNGARPRDFRGYKPEGAADYPCDMKVVEPDQARFPDGLERLDGGGFDRATLLARLARERAGAAAPIQMFDRRGDLTAPGSPVKLFVDCNRFYYDDLTDWITQYSWAKERSEKSLAEAEWLSHPVIPFRLRIFIKRREGPPFAWVPEALRGTDVRWQWRDFPQDTSSLPGAHNTAAWLNQAGSANATAAYARSGVHNRAKEYLDKAFRKVAPLRGTVYQGNAPGPFGGELGPDDNENSWTAFRDIRTGAAFARGDRRDARANAPGWVITRGPALLLSQPGLAHSVYLRTSYLGGDQYHVIATLDTEDHLELLRTMQPDLQTLLDEHRLEGRSARIAIWRRVRVSALIKWSDQDRDWLDRPVDLSQEWALVQQQYKHAFVQLEDLTPANNLSIAAGSLDFSRRFQAVIAQLRNSESKRLRDLVAELEPGGAPLPFDPAIVISRNFQVYDRPAALKDVVNTFFGGFAQNDLDYLGQVLKRFSQLRAPDPPAPAPATPAAEGGGPPDLSSSGEAAATANAPLPPPPPSSNAPPPPPSSSVPPPPPSSSVPPPPPSSSVPPPPPSSSVPPPPPSSSVPPPPPSSSVPPPPPSSSVPPPPPSSTAPPPPPSSSGPPPPLPRASLTTPATSPLTAPKATTPPAPRLPLPADELDWSTVHQLPHWAPGQIEPVFQPFPDNTPAVTSDRFDEFCDYLVHQLLPLANSILQTAVRVLGFAEAQKWVKSIQASWINTSNPPNRVRQLWLTRVIEHFVSAKEERNAYYTRTKEEIQTEGFAAIRAKFMDFFFPMLDRITYQINEAVRGQLYDRDEAPLADGLISVINFTHREIDLGARVNGPGRLSYLPMGASMALANGISYSSVTCFFKLYALLAHEAAHSLFLKHWISGDGPDFPSHDHAERNCIMQYPLLALPRTETTAEQGIDALSQIVLRDLKAGYTWKVFDSAVAGNGGLFNVWSDHALPRYFSPQFCGKCNLQLRGWNVLARDGGTQLLPKSSRDADPAQDAYEIKDEPAVAPDGERPPPAASQAARQRAAQALARFGGKAQRESPQQEYDRQRREYFGEILRHIAILEACEREDPSLDAGARQVLLGAARYYLEVFRGVEGRPGLLTRGADVPRIAEPYRK